MPIGDLIALTAEYYWNGLQQNLDVEQDRELTDIFEIEFESPLNARI
jgi:hypothetical protein